MKHLAGSFGVAAGGLLLFAKIASITALLDRPAAFLLAPVLARWVMVLAIFAFPYAREKGLGRDMKDQTGWAQLLFATLTAPDGRFLAQPALRQFVMIGLCGGYTTFSAFSLDAMLLYERGEVLTALVYVVGSVVLSILGLAFGLYAVRMLT